MSLTGVKAIEFSARRAHREPSWTQRMSSSWGVLHKAYQLYCDFKQSSSALFCFFQRSDDAARFHDSGTQHRLGRVFVFSSPRPTLGFIVHLLYIPIQNRASLSVGLPVRLFVFVVHSVFFFLSLFFTVQRPTLGFVFIYYIYLLFAAGTDPL